MKMNYKILAVAVVALFAATAFVAFAGEETDAANKEYNIYFEVLTADGKVTASDWKSFEYDGTNADWAAKVAPLYKEFAENYAAKVRDIDAYTVVGDDSGISFGYDGKPYTYWAGTFYEKSGDWALIFDTSKDYTGSNTAAVRLYDPAAYGVFVDATELPVGAEVKNYISYEASWAPGTTMYTLRPAATVDGYVGKISYNIFFEVLTADGKVTASEWKSFKYNGMNSDWAAKVAPLYKEFVQKNASKARDVDAYTVTANSTGISFGYDSSPFTYWAGAFYNKSGSWAMVFDTSEDYTGSNTASVRVYETGAYGVFVDAAELPVGADAKKYFSYEASWAPGTTMYTLLPSSAVDGYSSGDMTLYIIIAVIVVIVIVAAVVVVKKKKTA